MEIERINEDTIKFFISYLDIEKRGFHRDEIWYNREKSEELFWEMMEEVNYREDFEVEGPLWIQVQAHGRGLEFTVTRARLSASELEMFDSHLDDDSDEEEEDFPVDDSFEEIVKNKLIQPSEPIFVMGNEKKNFSIILEFSDFEHVIQLSHALSDTVDDVIDKLFYYDGKYYLYMEFCENLFDDDAKEDIVSLTLEFSEESDITIHILEEYGSVIFESQTFAQARSYFSS